MSHSEVAHNFAHQTGNKKNGFNVFYETNENGSSTIYSYGKHFGIAHILEPSKYGLNVCLFTEASYSVSTGKHISIVSSAVSHFDKIYVPKEVTEYIDFNGNLEVSDSTINSDINHFNSELETYINKHLRAIKYSYLDNILSTIDKAKKYSELFNCKHKLNGRIREAVYNDINTEDKVLETFFSDSEVQKIKDKREAQKQREAKKLKDSINAFRDGKRAFVSGTNYTYLRALTNEDNETIIQTSKSVNMTENEARMIWKTMQKAREDKTSFENVCTINGFNVSEVNSDYVKAGCHTVSFSEAKRIADKLKWD